MVEHVKKDFAQLTTVYGLAVLLLIVMSLVGVPLSILRSGIFSPHPEAISTLYNAHAFDAVSVKATSYIVYDINTGRVIAGKNEYTPYPLASITKVMTALTAVHIAPLSTQIVVNKKSIDGGYDLGLKDKQVWTLKNLLKYTLVFSSNDGAQLIADALLGRTAFVAKMNEYAQELGLGMQFTQPAGLDVNGRLGGLGSAYDVARMMALARQNLGDILDATTKTRVSVPSSTGPVIGIPNTNQAIDEFIGVEASKTGYTDSAGGNLVLSVDAALGQPVIIVILGSTREERFTDAYQLYLALIQSIR